jgi:hypothetical protein
MADEASKFIKLLDQLIPFLETFPHWFKIWIYILIFLIFLTVAGMSVLYLTGKEGARIRSSLKYFSIERPMDGEEIPLGDSKMCLIRGTFPVTDTQQSTSVNVDVTRLPQMQKIPQLGTPRISTVDGVWTYEYLQLPDDGVYDVVVTGNMNGQSVFRRVSIKCLEKAKAYANNISADRVNRGVPQISSVQEERLSLQSVKSRLYEMQNEYFSFFPGDLDGSLKVVSKAFDMVDRALPVYPNDLFLQNIRAYFFKNYAMVMERMNRRPEVDRALNESERMFEAILAQDHNDSGAWNGLGSVALLRRNPKKGLYFINRALELNPNYPDALEDRKKALHMLQELEKK